MVCEMFSRIRARLPPTEAWMPMAVTIRSRSSLPVRLTMAARARSVALPMFISRITRESSSATGAAVLRATVSSACGRERPAVSALESRLNGSGSRISAPSADWARLGSASASDARRTPIAATADTRMIPGTSGTTARRGVRLEHRRRKEFGPLREVIHVYRQVAQGGVEANGVAVIVDPKLAILEQLLRLRLAVAHTGDLADAHDLARSSSHPLGLNDHVHRRSDLLLDCARR